MMIGEGLMVEHFVGKLMDVLWLHFCIELLIEAVLEQLMNILWVP